MKGNKRSKLGSISSRSLAGQAYKIIKEAIISLKLEPGERLREVALAKELGISATPVKGALARLEQEGFVEITRFRGARVAGIDDQDVRDIFELRELLEGAAAKKAALNFSAEDLLKGEALLEAMREAYNISDIQSYAKPSRDFHYLLIEKFGNQKMIRVLKTLDDQLERIRITAIRTPENIPLFIEDYEGILEALKAGNPEEAEKALLAHLKRSKEAFSKSREHRGS